MDIGVDDCRWISSTSMIISSSEVTSMFTSTISYSKYKLIAKGGIYFPLQPSHLRATFELWNTHEPQFKTNIFIKNKFPRRAYFFWKTLGKLFISITDHRSAFWMCLLGTHSLFCYWISRSTAKGSPKVGVDSLTLHTQCSLIGHGDENTVKTYGRLQSSRSLSSPCPGNPSITVWNWKVFSLPAELSLISPLFISVDITLHAALHYTIDPRYVSEKMPSLSRLFLWAALHISRHNLGMGRSIEPFPLLTLPMHPFLQYSSFIFLEICSDCMLLIVPSWHIAGTSIKGMFSTAGAECQKEERTTTWTQSYWSERRLR